MSLSSCSGARLFLPADVGTSSSGIPVCVIPDCIGFLSGVCDWDAAGVFDMARSRPKIGLVSVNTGTRGTRGTTGSGCTVCTDDAARLAGEVCADSLAEASLV